jgi:hypothetical protein
LSCGERFAALHRGGGEFRLRLVAADDEHQQVLFLRLVVGHVHEAARHADREGNHVVRLQVDVFHGLALVPLGAPAPGHGDEGLVGVVVVHQRPLAGLRLAVAQVEALGDRDRRHRGGVGADRRISFRRRLEADHGKQPAPALGQLAVGQAAVGALQLPEAGDALHHFRARPGTGGFPGFHGRYYEATP